MKKIDNYVRFMLDNGLIFEINRQVLHPLGLALEVGIHPDNSKWVSIHGLVSVDDDDKEGFIFDAETFNVGAERYQKFLNKTGQSKLDSRLESLGYLIQESSGCTLNEFYSGTGRDSSGRTIDDYFNFSFEQMEKIHDYIQWIFPNEEPSPVNPDAPTIDKEDLSIFTRSVVEKSYNWFCSFIFDSRNDYIFKEPVNHNHLRCTRVLKFLVITGNKDLALSLYNELINKSGPNLELPKSYWKEAIDAL